MRTIYKYPLELEYKQVISVPILKASEHTRLNIKKQILKLDVQKDIPCLWIMVDNEERQRDVKVAICGTGDKCYEPIENYVDSFQTGAFVFHVFIKEE